MILKRNFFPLVYSLEVLELFSFFATPTVVPSLSELG